MKNVVFMLIGMFISGSQLLAMNCDPLIFIETLDPLEGQRLVLKNFKTIEAINSAFEANASDERLGRCTSIVFLDCCRLAPRIRHVSLNPTWWPLVPNVKTVVVKFSSEVKQEARLKDSPVRFIELWYGMPSDHKIKEVILSGCDREIWRNLAYGKVLFVPPGLQYFTFEDCDVGSDDVVLAWHKHNNKYTTPLVDGLEEVCVINSPLAPLLTMPCNRVVLCDGARGMTTEAYWAIFRGKVNMGVVRPNNLLDDSKGIEQSYDPFAPRWRSGRALLTVGSVQVEEAFPPLPSKRAVSSAAVAELGSGLASCSLDRAGIGSQKDSTPLSDSLRPLTRIDGELLLISGVYTLQQLDGIIAGLLPEQSWQIREIKLMDCAAGQGEPELAGDAAARKAWGALWRLRKICLCEGSLSYWPLVQRLPQEKVEEIELVDMGVDYEPLVGELVLLPTGMKHFKLTHCKRHEKKMRLAQRQRDGSLTKLVLDRFTITSDERFELELDVNTKPGADVTHVTWAGAAWEENMAYAQAHTRGKVVVRSKQPGSDSEQ